MKGLSPWPFLLSLSPSEGYSEFCIQCLRRCKCLRKWKGGLNSESLAPERMLCGKDGRNMRTQKSSPAQEGGRKRKQERESLRREGPQETDVWEALSREGSRQTPTQVNACETATPQSSPGLKGVVSSRVIFMCPRAGPSRERARSIITTNLPAPFGPGRAKQQAEKSQAPEGFAV